MCGIVGYVGPRKVLPLLIGGLQKLEYRGYDSAGVATIEDGKFEIVRAEGKLSKLRDILENSGKLKADGANGHLHTGIGHTRWATHGRPSETNAHPHVAGNICLVHNGIIENYATLRAELKKKGSVFSSETDSEIAAHLLNAHLEKTGNLAEAMAATTKELVGSYALVAISTKNLNEIAVARNSAPVIIGLGNNETFVASDIPAILEHTRQVIVLEDHDLAIVNEHGVSITNNGAKVTREPLTITWDPITAEKGGFRHFMLKEIYEQPQVVTETFRGRIEHAEQSIFLDDVKLTDEDIRKLQRICIVACGTAWHAGLVTKFFIEQFARMNVEVDYASEFRYRNPVVDDKTLFLAISQSGETADTLSSLQQATEQGAKTMAICNVVGSSITRKAQNVLYTHAGPEISVASTKAFVTQLTAGFLLALRLGAARGAITPEELEKQRQNLRKLPAIITEALNFDKQIEKIAKKYGRNEDFLFLGRGILYPIALEGALKLKEISYLHAEGYPAGELKHGPIALVNEETPVVVVFGHDGINYEKAMSNLKEVESRGGRIIAITDVATPELEELAWETIAIGKMPREMLPIALTVPLQLLAYHVAIYRGTDVDQPRNLAKSVTVE